MNKKKLQLILMFAVVLIAYNLVLFLVNKNFTTSFWVSYIFIMVALLFTFGSFSFINKNNRNKQVVGMPVNVLCVLYCVCEFVLGTIFMFFNLNFVPVFVPQFVLFALFMLCYIPAMLSEKNYKQEQPNKTEENQ